MLELSLVIVKQIYIFLFQIICSLDGDSQTIKLSGNGACFSLDHPVKNAKLGSLYVKQTYNRIFLHNCVNIAVISHLMFMYGFCLLLYKTLDERTPKEVF